MSKHKPVQYKDVGLEIALVFARYFFHSEYLHYGYWQEGVAVEPSNLLQAQEKYCELLLAHIPPGTKTILDVGCGTGRFSQELIKRGYSVDCVSPSALLTLQTRNRLGAEQVIFECRYEDLETERRYDLILFSESFQYVPLDRAFQNSLKFLNDNGHLLISDFFDTDLEEISPLGGGHSLKAFNEGVIRYQYTVLQNVDITAETAPNLDLVNGLVHAVAIPIYRSITNALRQNHPSFFRGITWVYRKRLAKLRRKYVGNARSSASFARFKSYRVLLCQRPPNGVG